MHKWIKGGTMVRGVRSVLPHPHPGHTSGTGSFSYCPHKVDDKGKEQHLHWGGATQGAGMTKERKLRIL